MKIALVTDQHFGVRNDNTKFLDYFEKFYSNIFFPKLKEEGIDTIIDLGDSFDRRKFINYYSLERSYNMFYDIIKANNMKMYSLVGNHNDYFKNTNDTNSVDLLLSRYDNIVCVNEPITQDFDGLDIVLLPWINSSNRDSSIEYIKTSKAQALFGHLELQGFEMYRGAINDHGDDPNLFNKFDIVCSGHFHHKSTRGNINYLGSPYEMTWSDFNDPKGFHIFDTATRELTFVQNPYTMFNKVWYDDTDASVADIVDEDFSNLSGTFVKVIVKNKTNPYWFDMFIDRIEKADVSHLQVVEDHLNLDLEDDEDLVNEAEDTLTILKKYVDQLDIKADKVLVDQLVRDLYSEALSVS